MPAPPPTRAARSAGRDFAKTFSHAGLSRARLILQGYQKPACGRLVTGG